MAMKKQSEFNSTGWFKHDSNARHTPKLRLLREEFGHEGLSWYWWIVEMLRETEEPFTIDLSHKYLKKDLAQEFAIDIERLDKFISTCCELDLLVMKKGKLRSPGLTKRLAGMVKERNEMRERASIAGKASAEKRKLAMKESNRGSSDVERPSTSRQQEKSSAEWSES